MARRIRRRQPDFPPLSQSPFVSIIIVTWQTGGRFIESCLNALHRLEYPDFETIIVDNHSNDQTGEVLRELARNEQLIFNSTNRGFGGGCNDGIRKARGEVLVFLNVDTEVEPDWLAEIVRPLTENHRAAITGCKTYYPGGERIQHAGGVLFPNGETRHIGYNEKDQGQYDQLREVDFVTGAAIAIRRDFLELCGGGFDEDFFPAYYEDADLCYRAKLMGYQVLIAPAARLIHHESPVLENTGEQYQRLCYRARMIFCWKNYRLRDWAFEWLPHEAAWIFSRSSKGFRKKQLRAYLDLLLFLRGRRLEPDPPGK